MFNLPETHFHFGGDEYIYAEISRDMRIESNFKALAVTNELRSRDLPGIIDIVSANSSYLVRYNPDLISVRDLLDCLKEVDLTKSDPKKLQVSVRMIEIPAWYDDPVSREYSFRFKNRHPEPELSNFDFVMKVNHFTNKEAFIEYHAGTPYFITMVGFLPGTAWHFPLGQDPSETLRTPKYHSPRTETPERGMGLGGAFNVIYPVSGPGTYQLIGRAAVPVFDPKGQLADLKETPFLARPGDIWKYRPVNESQYNQIMSEVEAGVYRFKMKEMIFSPLEYMEKGNQYIQEFMEGF